MGKVKYQSRKVDRTEDGEVSSICYFGTESEMKELQNQYIPGKETADGIIKKTAVTQESSSIWNCEIQFQKDKNGISVTSKPSTDDDSMYATLSCSMIPLPLEKVTDYLTKWNHYLFGDPDSGTTVPAFWDTATNTVLTGTDATKYAWGKELSDAPNVNGKRWLVLKDPVKPGVETVDKACYTITEHYRCSKPARAGAIVQNSLNKIGSPKEDFGVTPSGYNWKCDDAQVQWTGKYWKATLTWTMSGNNAGWDDDLY